MSLDPRPPVQNYRALRTVSGRRIFTLRFQINPTPARRIMAMGPQLSMAAGLDEKFNIRIVRGRGGTLNLEVPRPSPWQPLRVSDLPRWHGHGIMAVIGADSENRAAGVDFARHDRPHILIAGATGSGKTNAAGCWSTTWPARTTRET